MALTKGNTQTGSGKEFDMNDSDMAGDTVVLDDTVTRALSADERVAAAAAAKAAKAADSKAADSKAADSKAADSKAANTEAPAKASTSTEVAAPAKPNELVIAMTTANPFRALENAIHVDYNSLTRIMVTNGNIQNKETKALAGETCVLDLISYQKHTVMSPGGEQDDEESLQYLKYSDDGKTERESGRPLTEFRDAAIKAGYDKARINERIILVGEVVDIGKLNDSLKGELVQMDLAPRSVGNFNTHVTNTAFKVAKGRIPAVGATRVKITAAVQSKNKLNWTDAEFSLPGEKAAA